MIKKKTFKFHNEYDTTDQILIVFEDPDLYIYSKDGNYKLKFVNCTNPTLDFWMHQITYSDENHEFVLRYTKDLSLIKGKKYHGSLIVTRGRYYKIRFFIKSYEQRYKFNIYLFNKAQELYGKNI